VRQGGHQAFKCGRDTLFAKPFGEAFAWSGRPIDNIVKRKVNASEMF
jgi:hypothetical protein